MTSPCEYCGKARTVCLQQFEVEFLNDVCYPFIEFTCLNINEAINAAHKYNESQRSKPVCFDHELVRHMRVYQGCQKENEIYQQEI